MGGGKAECTLHLPCLLVYGGCRGTDTLTQPRARWPSESNSVGHEFKLWRRHLVGESVWSMFHTGSMWLSVIRWPRKKYGFSVWRDYDWWITSSSVVGKLVTSLWVDASQLLIGTLNRIKLAIISHLSAQSSIQVFDWHCSHVAKAN